jgi:hypothetical protein
VISAWQLYLPRPRPPLRWGAAPRMQCWARGQMQGHKGPLYAVAEAGWNGTDVCCMPVLTCGFASLAYAMNKTACVYPLAEPADACCACAQPSAWQVRQVRAGVFASPGRKRETALLDAVSAAAHTKIADIVADVSSRVGC